MTRTYKHCGRASTSVDIFFRYLVHGGMDSGGSRLLELYEEGGLPSVYRGFHRFVFHRWLRAVKKVSTEFGKHNVRLFSGGELRSPVFVVGCPRSGTSIFVRQFRRHPDVAEWSEAGEIWDPNYHDPEADHVFTDADVTPEDRARIRSTFETYTRLRRKDRFVNKHPRNSLRVEFIREIFPDARFVHVVRHPIGPVDSMIRRSKQGDRTNHPYGRFVKPPGWRDDIQEDDLVKFSRSWKKVNDYLLERHDDSFITVTYEDFCSSPADLLNDVCQFGDLEPAFEPSDVDEEIAKQNSKSVENLDSGQIDRLWSITRDTASEFDYGKHPE